MSLAADDGQLRAELARVTAERDELRNLLAAPDPTRDPEYWRSLFAIGHGAELADSWAAGYRQCDRDRDAAWSAFTHQVVTRLTESDSTRVRRALANAEAGCRRDAAVHERAFVARAYATPDHGRSDVQRATVRLYPPPARRRAA